ncbi:hypothetical protein BGZ61DRAFT_438149 [Ilyonectria robusta]|uniref:uncharacterized protein n=1 Tax=Ilyonectria robusta TaxID=1079257 RepID=UPI001E8E73E8|nr:uncharacterized protein BGZ61DRAFT_438149 [Ilyonectria robusta]KAH8737349.1 hypothetical protein BGZ61DRAFT_438149 [Ilyonectria robusta]
MDSSCSIECETRCAELISFGMLLQRLSTETALLDQKPPSRHSQKADANAPDRHTKPETPRKPVSGSRA